MLNPDFRDMLSALSDERADFLRRADLLAPGVVVQIGVAPRRIDLLTSIDGVNFEDAWQHRVDIDVDGVRVPVIGRRHLIANKKTVGRPQDLADVARLETEAPPSH